MLAVALAGASVPWQAAAKAEISHIRMETPRAGLERLVLTLSQWVEHRTFLLTKPDRLVVDLPLSTWKLQAYTAGRESRLVRQIRLGRPDPETSRIVLDLSKAVSISSASLRPVSLHGEFRLYVDFTPRDGVYPGSGGPLVWQQESSGKKVGLAINTAFVQETAAASIQSGGETIAGFRPAVKPRTRRKLPVVVIDPGHGGKDPGAVSKRHQIREKNVTLRYARALRDALNRTGRFKAALTRTNDTFISLRKRIRLARKHGGDLFISLHADSSPGGKARGLSVYTLSEKASDREAELLAQQENKADIIHGVDLSVTDEDVADILIDLAQRETKNKSTDFAETVIREVKKHVKLLRNTHRSAGFAVLKAPDIPSILIELGFLSNARDEANLMTKDYQEKVITGLVKAVAAHFKRHPTEIVD